MKLKFQAKKHKRMHYGFIGVQVDNETLDYDMLVNNKGHWGCYRDSTEYSSNTHYIKSLKAFKRYIKKLHYLPKGTVVRLISRFVSHDVFYTIS